MAEVKKEIKENIHKGHRDRVKKKFLANGFNDSTPDHEILEMLLFYSVPQKDTNELAHTLINHFGNFYNIFDASPQELMQVSGISEHSAALIKLMLPLYRRYANSKSAEKLKLNSFEQFAEYVKELYSGETREVLRIYLFNNKKELVGKEILGVGDIDSVKLSGRKIIEIALRYNATGAIISHNHPQGFAVPSRQDRLATSDVKSALNKINVVLYDHVIVGNNQYFSMIGDEEYKYFLG